MKRKYDLIFGLGRACGCSETMRKAGLQHLSFPGDWTVCPAQDHDLRLRVDTLCGDLSDFFRPEDFRLWGNLSVTGKAVYKNTRTHYLFNHDFPFGGDFASDLPKVAEKYRRRRDRLFELIGRSRRVLVVNMDIPGDPHVNTPDDCRYARRRLGERFPSARFDCLLVSHDPARPFEQRTFEVVEDGLFLLSFDFLDRKRTDLPNQPDLALTSAALAEHFAVRDYRTRDERRHWKEKRLRERLRNSGAKSVFQYRLLKLRRSFEKRFGFLHILTWPRTGEHVDQILPLGTNCEVAFRFYRQWGFLDSSLFAWAQSVDLETLTAALRDLDRIFSGGTEFDRNSFMWKCSVTGLYFHGYFKFAPNTPPPGAAELDADRTALHGRIRHLRDKFRDYVANEKSTLFVHRLCPKDAAAPDLDRRLAALEQVLADRLAARNWRLLVVCEEKERARMPEGPNRLFRTVRAFSPPDRVTDPNAGDSRGWRAIFTEFAPTKILPKAHGFKFE